MKPGAIPSFSGEDFSGWPINIPFLIPPTHPEISLVSVPVSLLCVGLECSSAGFLECDPSFCLQE